MESNEFERWHLAKSDQEAKLTEFEFSLWRVFYAFTRWQEDCQNCIDEDNELNAYDLSILHVLRMNDRPKNVYKLSILLNRNDIPNIQYSIRKLLKIGLIEKCTSDTKKSLAYQITEKGINNTDAYTAARKNILINMIKNEFQDLDFIEMSKMLTTLKGIYDEAGRVAASYKNVAK